ncbi:MAG: hypothetical protein KAT53_02355 [Dehalococcoidia bacterium]|nr:hypothetical protein [Dehalococcoidia bacterium]
MLEKAAEDAFEASYRVGAVTLRTEGQKIPFDRGAEGCPWQLGTVCVVPRFPASGRGGRT